MKFSVATVVKDDYRGLKKTLSSVLKQTNSELFVEVIVIDAGMRAMKNETVATMLRGHPMVRYTAEPDEGVYFGMNKALEQATGDWMLFLNTGDVFHSSHVLSHLRHYLETELQFRTTTDLSIVVGSFVENWRGHEVVRSPQPIRYMPRVMPSSHQALVIPVTVCKRYRFDTTYAVCADAHQIARMERDGAEVYRYGGIISIVQAEGYSSDHFSVMMREKLRIQREHYPGVWSWWEMYSWVCIEYGKKKLRWLLPNTIEKLLRHRKYKRNEYN